MVSSQHRRKGSSEEDIEAHIHSLKKQVSSLLWRHWKLDELKRVRQRDYKF